MQGAAPKLRLQFVVIFHKNEFKFPVFFFSEGFLKQFWIKTITNKKIFSQALRCN